VSKKKDGKENLMKRLAAKDRNDVLPIVNKILLTKLVKKKGSINKKNIHTRRNIIF
jgi:hypothetical protein